MDIYSTGSDLIFGKIGHLFIIITFISVIVSTISYFIATQYSNNSNTASWIGLGRKAFIVHTISAIGIFSILFILLFTHSFQYKYIWQHSSQDLPVFYIFSAMWSGQEGSTMLWIFWTAIVGCVLIFRAKSYETGVMTFVSLSQVMLCAMLLGIYIFDYKLGSSPFALLKDTMDIPIFKMNPNYIPGDGTGLNPSLQNYWMVIHPPTLFLGFALTTVPAAFAFASLWKKEYTQFAEAVLPWTLIALMILGAGILMGGAWAYEALNFGGFWAWDPVENASLVPWLILAAALHTVIVYKHTGHSLSITYAFFLMAYLLVLYSSFMTKSGVLGDASVHSFTDLGMSGLLISTILVFLIPSLGLYFYRSFKKQIPFKETEEATSSREFWLFIGALLFTLSAIHITGLTSFPVFNKLPFIKNKLAPPSDIKSHYNHVQIWLAMFAAFGTAMVQFLKFTKTNLKGFFKNFIWSLAGGIIVTIGIVAYYKINRIDYILMLVAGWFTIFSNINYIKNVMKGKVKVSGGYVSHIGFGLMMVGIVVSQGEQEVVSINRYGINYGSGFTADESAENILLYQHEPQVMGKYKVTYLGDSIHDKNIYFNVLYEQMNKKNEIVKRFTLHPNILLNQKMGNNPVPSTRKTLESDLYTHITMAPLKEDGTQVDSIVEEKHTLGVGDTLMLSRAFAIIEGINTHAEVKGIEKKPNDVAVGVKMRYVDLDTQYTIEPVYFIRDMMATSIEAEAHDHKTKIAVTRIIPESNKFEFTVEETLHKYIIMKAIKFPFINVLWLGILVMVSGIFISMQKRLSDNKRKYAAA